MGGGFEIALGCDIRIASENAQFGLPEVTLGVFPAGGSTQRLPRLIPQGIAAEMLFTGKRIDAQEAYRVGLVNKVIPVGEVMTAAKEAMIKVYNNMTLEEGLRLEETIAQYMLTIKDFAEGITAFAEKRKPRFKCI